MKNTLRSLSPAMVAVVAALGVSACTTFTEADRALLNRAAAESADAKTSAQAAAEAAAAAARDAAAAQRRADEAARAAAMEAERMNRMSADDMRKR